MKQLLLLTSAAVCASALAAAPAVAQDEPETRSADDAERRCCIVDEGRWVREPRSLWTRAECAALGEEGEYAPQGTPRADACLSGAPPDDPIPDPSPLPPDPGDDDDTGEEPPRDGNDDGDDEAGGDNEGDDETANLACPNSWGEPRSWSPADARTHAVAHAAACDRLIAAALAAGDWAALEALRANLELWALEPVELSDPLAEAMSGGTPPDNIGEIAAAAAMDIHVLSGAQRAALVLENFIEAAQIAAPNTQGAVTACTGEGLWRFESEGDVSQFVRAADAAYVGTLWRSPGTEEAIPIRQAVETWASFTVPEDAAACPDEGAADAVRLSGG